MSFESHSSKSVENHETTNDPSSEQESVSPHINHQVYTAGIDVRKLTPHDILYLQRTIGNTAVVQLIQRSREREPNTSIGNDSSEGVIQRMKRKLSKHNVQESFEEEPNKRKKKEEQIDDSISEIEDLEDDIDTIENQKIEKEPKEKGEIVGLIYNLHGFTNKDDSERFKLDKEEFDDRSNFVDRILEYLQNQVHESLKNKDNITSIEKTLKNLKQLPKRSKNTETILKDLKEKYSGLDQDEEDSDEVEGSTEIRILLKEKQSINIKRGRLPNRIKKQKGTIIELKKQIQELEKEQSEEGSKQLQTTKESLDEELLNLKRLTDDTISLDNTSEDIQVALDEVFLTTFISKFQKDDNYVSTLLDYFAQLKELPSFNTDPKEFLELITKVKELRQLEKDFNKLSNNMDDYKKYLDKNLLKNLIGISKHIDATLNEKGIQNSDASLIISLDKELNKLGIVSNLQKILEKTDMDFMLLNEMNQGINSFKKEIEENKNYGVEKGPKMASMTQKDTPSQREYYPLVYNKKRFDYMEYFFIGVKNGKVEKGDEDSELFEEGVDDEEYLPWKKPVKNKLNEKLDYRPLIVHKLVDKTTKEELWLTAVHTTPYGSEFERIDIFKQIQEPLKELKSIAVKAKAKLVVGGDFYIADEALVDKQGKRLVNEGYSSDLKKEGKIGLDNKKKRSDPNELRNLFADKARKKPFNFEHNLIQDSGLVTVRSTTGTNKNSSGLQSADYFIVLETMKDLVSVGLIHPETFRAYNLESEDQDISNPFLKLSDHLPVVIRIKPNKEKNATIFEGNRGDDELFQKDMKYVQSLEVLQKFINELPPKSQKTIKDVQVNFLKKNEVSIEDIGDSLSTSEQKMLEFWLALMKGREVLTEDPPPIEKVLSIKMGGESIAKPENYEQYQNYSSIVTQALFSIYSSFKKTADSDSIKEDKEKDEPEILVDVADLIRQIKNDRLTEKHIILIQKKLENLKSAGKDFGIDGDESFVNSLKLLDDVSKRNLTQPKLEQEFGNSTRKDVVNDELMDLDEEYMKVQLAQFKMFNKFVNFQKIEKDESEGVQKSVSHDLKELEEFLQETPLGWNNCLIDSVLDQVGIEANEHRNAIIKRARKELLGKNIQIGEMLVANSGVLQIIANAIAEYTGGKVSVGNVTIHYKHIENNIRKELLKNNPDEERLKVLLATVQETVAAGKGGINIDITHLGWAHFVSGLKEM